MIKDIDLNKGRNADMEFETDKPLINKIQYRKYVVNPKKCTLEIGDFITPETIIGLQYETGQPVTAGINGRAVTICHNPTNDSVMMLAVAIKND